MTDHNNPRHKLGIQWLTNALVKHRSRFILLILSAIVIQLCELAAPASLQVVLDKVIVQTSLSTLVWAIAALGIIGVLECAVRYLQTYALTSIGSRFDLELGEKLFRHMLRLPIAYFEKAPDGQIIARIRELDVIRNFVIGQSVASLVDGVFAILFLGILLMYSPALTVIVAVSMLLHLITVLSSRPRLITQANQYFEANATSQQILSETIHGALTIKATSAETAFERRWNAALKQSVHTAVDRSIWASGVSSVLQLITKLSAAVQLFVGVVMVLHGRLTIGQLLAFNMIAAYLQAPITRLTSIWQSVQQIKISLEKIENLIGVQAEQASLLSDDVPLPSGPVAIQFNGVYFSYDKDIPVLRDLNLLIPAGQVLGIVGLSGSGKSTLIKLLQKLHVPQKGDITVGGTSLAARSPSWVRNQVSVVLQESVLFNKSIKDNIALGRENVDLKDVVQAAKIAGADEFIGQLALGYESILNERGSNLSHGQRQRLAIARAIFRAPSVLIFDEATSSLDYETERLFIKNLEAISLQRTVIIISHRLGAIQHCQRILSISAGKIIQDNTHEVLVEEDGLYRNLWNLQF